MPGILTPVTLEAEEILNFPATGSATLCRMVSGYANFYPDDDEKRTVYDVHMVVGPKWLDVRDCSPIVGIDGFSFMDNDSAGASGTEILDCKWDRVASPEGQTNFERIRLKVKLKMCGGDGYSVLKLGYHLLAVGR